jgi:C4-dicarboxylate-specific signal transduction histidine kinase
VRFLERGDVATTRANLERIAQLVDRMGLITGQLRAFARKSSGQLQPVALCRALDNALALLEPRCARPMPKLSATARYRNRSPCAMRTGWSRCWST